MNIFVQLKNEKYRLKNKLHAKKSRPSELKGTETTLATKKYTSLLPTEHRIYNHLSKEILTAVNLTDIKSQLLLVVDKRKGKEGINKFDKYLSNHLKAILPLNVACDISHEQSHQNTGLQAVDLFCWGLYRKYEYNDDAWFSIYKD